MSKSEENNNYFFPPTFKLLQLECKNSHLRLGKAPVQLRL